LHPTGRPHTLDNAARGATSDEVKDLRRDPHFRISRLRLIVSPSARSIAIIRREPKKGQE
jgi:hypothetical protein